MLTVAPNLSLASGNVEASVKKNITITAPSVELKLRVSLISFGTTSGKILKHVLPMQMAQYTEELEGGIKRFDRDKNYRHFWQDVMNFYSARVESADRQKLIPPQEQEPILRTHLLGLIGIAYPQQDSVLIRRHISGKTTTAMEKNDQNEVYPETALNQVLDDKEDFKDKQLYEHAAMSLLKPDTYKNDELSQEYDHFEQDIFAHVRKIISTGGEREKIYSAINDHLSRIRKKADEKERLLLDWLQGACDSAMMHMYSYYAGAVINHVDIRSELDEDSYYYNKVVHAVQNRFGGIVLALHPIWAFCLGSPTFVQLLVDIAHSPSSKDVLNKFNKAVLRWLIWYERLFKLEKSVDNNFVNIDARVPVLIYNGKSDYNKDDEKMGKLKIGDTLSQNDLEVVPLDTDLINHIKSIFPNDQDVQMALDIACLGMSVKECAKKYTCSFGEVSKKKQKGLAKLKCSLKQEGGYYFGGTIR